MELVPFIVLLDVLFDLLMILELTTTYEQVKTE